MRRREGLLMVTVLTTALVSVSSASTAPFTIVRGDRLLATGEHVRGRDARMIFAGGLGGPYVPGAPKTAPTPRPAGGATQEL